MIGSHRTAKIGPTAVLVLTYRYCCRAAVGRYSKDPALNISLDLLFEMGLLFAIADVSSRLCRRRAPNSAETAMRQTSGQRRRGYQRDEERSRWPSLAFEYVRYVTPPPM